MKKKVLLCISVAIVLSLTACVSQKEYDQLSTEKEQVESQYSDLNTKNNDLNNKYEDLNKKYEDLQVKYSEEQKKNADYESKQEPLEAASSWVKSSFGDSATCSLDNQNHLSVHIPTNYTASDYMKILKETRDSLSTLEKIDSPTSDTTEYKYITITFYDKNQNGIISYLFDNSNKKHELKTIMPDIYKIKELTKALPN